MPPEASVPGVCGGAAAGADEEDEEEDEEDDDDDDDGGRGESNPSLYGMLPRLSRRRRGNDHSSSAGAAGDVPKNPPSIGPAGGVRDGILVCTVGAT